MADILYFLWALLPVVLFWSVCRSAGKNLLKVRAQESTKSYIVELAYSIAGLVLAIIIDKTVFESLRPTLSNYGIDPRIVRWLIYPAVLTTGAVIQQSFANRKTAADEAEKKARRMKYASK